MCICLWQDVMIFDHSVFSGMADIHDRHRDMRLDVDNMSYEVKEDFPFWCMCTLSTASYPNQYMKFMLYFNEFLIIFSNIVGVVGSGRTYWKCEYWIERGNYIETTETEEVFSWRRISGWGRTLLCLSGKPRLPDLPRFNSCMHISAEAHGS